MLTGSSPSPEDVAVLVRSAGEPGLQGLRTALSLSLGDRRPRVYLSGPGLAMLEAEPGSEAGACLQTLAEAGVGVLVDGRDLDHEAFLGAIRAARFQQTF